MSSRTSAQKPPTKRERREEMARKREERAIRKAHRNERKAQAYLNDDANFVSFKNQLNALGLEIKDIPGDGNCLFRALGDQLDGSSKQHLTHRADVVDFMLQHRDDFEPFVEDDVPFQRHVNSLKKPGTYAGNDTIVAFARLHKLTVVIHQFNSPPWQIHGEEKPNARQLHISYHNGEHYSSVRRIGDTSSQPTNIRLKDGDKSAENSSGTSKGSKYHQGYEAHYDYGWQGDEQEEAGYEWQSPDFAAHQDTDKHFCDYGVTTVNHCDTSGVARATRTLEDYVQNVITSTGCQDVELIQNTLLDCEYDLDATVAIILHLMPAHSYAGDSGSEADAGAMNGLWAEQGTGSRLFGAADHSSSGAKPKNNVNTSRQSAKQKKLEKKARAAQRHKERLLGSNPQPEHHLAEDDDEAHIVHSIATLKI